MLQSNFHELSNKKASRIFFVSLWNFSLFDGWKSLLREQQHVKPLSAYIARMSDESVAYPTSHPSAARKHFSELLPSPPTQILHKGAEKKCSDMPKLSQKILLERVERTSQKGGEKFKWKREKIPVIQLQLSLTFATFKLAARSTKICDVECSRGAI